MKIRIPAGVLRNSVYIMQPVSGAKDSLGAPTITWQSLFNTTVDSVVTPAKIRAAIWPINGREFLAAQEINSKLDMRIRVRYHAGIQPKMRVVWGNRTFEISAIIQAEMRKVFIDLMCYEIRTAATGS